MTERDDDPVHPNWDGIVFLTSTDRKGVIITAASANSVPPYTYMTVSMAASVLGDLRAVIYGIESHDRGSYLAIFLDLIAADLADAITTCRPEFDHASEADDAGPPA